MISAQTRSAFVARENRCPPIGSRPEGMLFRIMLYREKLTISTQFGFLPTGYSFSFESLPAALSIA
jgi:hypothetical protein